MTFCPICGKGIANAQEQFDHLHEHTPEEIQQYEAKVKERQKEYMDAQINRENIFFTRGGNFSKIYATEWAISLTDLDVRIDILNERRNHPPNPLFPNKNPPVEFIVENQIISPIISAKTLHIRLGELIQMYENQNGEIPIRP